MRRCLLVIGFVTLVAPAATAQLPVLDLRLGAHAGMPTGDLGDAYDTGFGVYGRLGAPVGPLKLMASATWNRLKGIATASTTDLDVVTVTAGPHFGMAMLDVGIEGGYFSQFQEFGASPNVSLKLLRYELTASYNMTFQDPKGSWLTLGAGLRF
ncbi:MAG: hypothetical protein OEW77_01670 [Gemmatimonadota bacterium]|nr:hypothetical protein [Gemmatimonadota bacterium]